MGRILSCLFAAALLLCPVAFAADVNPPDSKPAEKKEHKKESPRIYPRGPEIEALKANLGMTDEQIAKAREAVAGVAKKNEELDSQAAVAAAEAEVKKAKEALKAAEEKANAAKDNFDLNEEYKKAVLSAVPADKQEKAAEMLHYKPAKPKAPKMEAKDGEKKAEEKK